MTRRWRSMMVAGSAAFWFAGTEAGRAQDEARIEAGRYIATAAGCASCHTNDPEAPYAGGLALQTPFGPIYSNNITPDNETGLGEWTLEDFRAAMHQGVSADGEYIYPAMPYNYYTKMHDQDVEALWAYLQSLRPIRYTAPEPDLTFPFGVREGIAGWQVLYLDDSRFEADPERSDAWNRGAYLVEALGHCGACHTPKNAAMAPIEGLALTGSRVENWYAPDISNSPYSQIARWNQDELARLLRGDRDGPNYVAIGPMRHVTHDSLARLDAADLDAIVTYLQDQPPLTKEPPARETVEISEDRLAAGEQLYGVHCYTCHQAGGAGIPAAAPTLDGNATVKARRPYNTIMALLQGFEARGTWSRMPAYAELLTDRDIADITNYLRTSWSNGAAPNATASMVGDWRAAGEFPDFDETAEPEFVCPVLTGSDFTEDQIETIRGLDVAASDGRDLKGLVDDYRGRHPEASSADVTAAFLAVYCPAVSTKDIGYDAKNREFARFIGAVAAEAQSGSENEG